MTHNIYKDGTAESEADKETGKYHKLIDDIRNNSEQNDEKEEPNLEKYHGIAMLHKLLQIILLILCFTVAVEHEYNKQNNSIGDSDTENEADSCSDQRDEEKMFDVRKIKVFVLPVTICMYDNGDDNLSTAVDFHVGNVVELLP